MLTLYIIKLAWLVWVSFIFLVIEVETNMLQIAMLIKLLTMWLLLHFVVIAKVVRYSTVFAVLQILILNT